MKGVQLMSHPDDRVHVFATIKPKPEYFEEAKTALEQLIEPTLEEPGCHLFTVFKSCDEPNVLHLFEIFKDKAAIEAHYAKEYTKQVFLKYKEWLLVPVDVHHLSVTSNLSADQYK